MELLQKILVETWANLAEMAPYLLLGFFVAGLLSVFVSPETVEKQLGGRGLWPVLKAALFGIPLPLCSCGVIPVAVSLRRHGASRGAATSFLISTPQTGVDSILVTYSLLGPVFAVFRPLAALLSGLAGGAAVSAFDDRETGENLGEETASCSSNCCPAEDPRRGRIARAMHYGFVTLPEDIAKALIIGLLLAGLIAALVPDDFFAAYFGDGFTAMLVMLVVGIPLYVCATGSVPIAAALMVKGISPGAALVFLMTGPATNAATISTIWKVLGRRTALLYLLTVCLAALATGAALDFTLAGSVTLGHGSHGAVLPPWFNRACALALAGILAFALRPRWLRRTIDPKIRPVNEARTIQLSITGMSCNHCVNSVSRALSETPGVKEVEVDLAGGRAVVLGEDVDPRDLCAKIEGLGYGASPA